ncbi:MAG: hypothetical protein HOQ09_03330 [Gemmatimonadaceae bacterium]|nr:hypothetical protein [Gemmatimonadaceae bacterium]
MRITRVSAALAAATILIGGVRRVDAQQTFPQTIYWGSGLVDIPTAWVSPLPGDFAINYSGKHFNVDPNPLKVRYNSTLNSQLTFSISGWNFLEAGWAAYSANPEWGFFGKALLINQQSMRAKGGAAGWVPSVAVGMRNVGPYKHIDRFGVGYNLLPPGVDPNQKHVADTLHQNFNTANTVYGVATESFALTDIRPSWADIDLSFSVGYGNGLFSDDGGLGAAYAKHATGGLFYGGKLDFSPTANVGLSLMAENNAWDYNVGANLNYRGIRAGVYMTELGSGSAPSTPTTTTGPNPALGATDIYNYSKFVFSIGWQSNVFALLHGDFLQNKAAELERARQGLLAEIQRRQQRIAALELEINRYEAQNLLELEQRRAQAEAELRAEREALQRLEERLRRVESQSGVPPTSTPTPTPAPSNPPQL